MGRHTICCCVLLLGACQGEISTEFPPGLEPFDDDDEPAKLDDARTESLRSRSTSDGIIRVYGRGYVFAPPAVVYAAAHDPQVMIAKCKTTSQGIMFGNEPEYELSFRVHYFVDDILNVEWDDQWRADVILGTLEAPELVMIKHQKIEGSDFITVSEGTIELFATDDPEISELQFVEHLDAVQGSAGDVLAGMQHNYDRLVAVAHGAAIPACP